MFVRQRITIVRIRQPDEQPLNDKLQTFGHALGLFGERDRDRSCFRIFIELLKSTRFGGLSSDELALRLNLTRGTVVHHLHTLRERGIVQTEGNRYLLRGDSLKEIVAGIRNDANKVFDELASTAEELDVSLGL